MFNNFIHSSTFFERAARGISKTVSHCGVFFWRSRSGAMGDVSCKNIVRVSVLLLSVLVSGCTGQLQTKISGNLNQLSRQQVVAVLPPELTGDGQKGAGKMFRQSLYANLQHARFRLMERNVVDSLLHQNRLTKPADLKKISPLRLGEVLGADAVVITRINKVKRSYLVLHSSIEVDISVEMVDTRTGEVLWRAEQTESDFQGLGKIPTGMSSAVLAPIQFVTNKLNLNRITHAMVTKLTNLVKRPERAKEEETFDKTIIAKTAQRDLAYRETHQKANPKKVVVAKVAQKMAGVKTNKMFTPTSGKLKSEAATVKRSTSKRAPLWETMDLSPRQRGQVQRPAPVPMAAPGQQLASIPGPGAGPAMVSTLTKPAPAAKKRPVRKFEGVRIASMEQPPSGVLYTLQVGAYKTKAFAERALNYLVSKGHDAFVSWFKKDDEKIYRVHVDKYKDRKTAIQASRELKAKENLPTIISTVHPK